MIAILFLQLTSIDTCSVNSSVSVKMLHSVCFVDIQKSLLFTSHLLCVSVEADFNTTSFQVVFPADPVPLPVRPSINVEIPIFDDDINERFEQLFLITSEVVDAVNPSTIDNFEGNVTIGIIVDNDGRYRTSVCRCREGGGILVVTLMCYH